MMIVDLLLICSDIVLHCAIMFSAHNCLLIKISLAIGSVFYNSLQLLFIYYLKAQISEATTIKFNFERVALPIFAINIVIWFLTPFNGKIIDVSAQGVVRGDWYWLGQVGGYLILIVALFMIVYYHKALGREKCLVLASVPMIPVVAAGLRVVIYGISYMPLSITIALQLLYHTICVRESINGRRQKTELENIRVELALSQIKPHFLYNVLNTIYILCKKDSKQAQNAIVTFSNYLRADFENMDKESSIPFSKEMEFVRNYITLEKLRFQNLLQFEEDCTVTSFEIPPFVVQPIVENAVKHGIQKKRDGVVIRVTTRQTDNGVEIHVTDNGAGFDVESLYAAKNAETGLSNVEKKLRLICRGSLEIKSKTGKGTDVFIRIPHKSV